MTTVFTAGQKMRASDLNVFTASAAASADTVMSGSIADITGATVTFTTTHSNVSVIVNGVFDCDCIVATNTAIGYLSVDGVQQSAQAIIQFSANGNRVTAAQNWNVTLSSSGSHTLKLRGTQTGGTHTIHTQHTTLVCTVFDI